MLRSVKCRLSPIHLNIYIESLHFEIAAKGDIAQYADEFLVIVSGNSREEAENLIVLNSNRR